MTSATVPDHIPANATAAGDGILIGDGPVTVDAYIDFLCPYCREFELSSEDTLNAMVADGLISLAYHPMSFLDEASSTRYSSRAAAASGCASDGGKFREYLRALFVSQPPEGGPGLTDAELVELGASSGLTDAAFSRGVLSGRYLDWPPYVTELAAAAGVSGTPTVLIAGDPAAADPRAITAAVAAAARKR